VERYCGTRTKKIMSAHAKPITNLKKAIILQPNIKIKI